jgi:hypothetical protein
MRVTLDRHDHLVTHFETRGSHTCDGVQLVMTCSTTEGVESEESLKVRAVVSQMLSPIHHIVGSLLPNRVVALCM